jgi:hypothetical protein
MTPRLQDTVSLRMPTLQASVARAHPTKSGIPILLRRRAPNVIAERLMQPSNSWVTIETNRKVHEAQPLQDLIEKVQNPSQHVKVQLGDLKACRACAAAGRRSKQTQKRRPLEELSRNTLRGTAQANAGRADRLKRDASNAKSTFVRMGFAGTSISGLHALQTVYEEETICSI